jgi:hypothetical protein
MKSEKPRRSSDAIAEELQQWLDDQPSDKVNPLLDIAGKSFARPFLPF